jgi:hypothetical protein
MMRTLFILIFFTPAICLGQFKFVPDQTIPVSVGNKVLAMPWAGGLNSAQANTIDLDGDGTEDLLIFDRTSGKLNPFLLKSGKYIYAPEYTQFFPDDIEHWLILADYNCNGKKDIFTSTLGGIKVYENTSQGSSISWKKIADPLFGEGFSRPVNIQLNHTDIPVISDLDGDGDLDILVYNFSTGHHIDYFKNLSKEEFGNCDSLHLKRITRTYGKIDECGCNNFAFEGDSCDYEEEFFSSIPAMRQKKLEHVAGRSMLALNIDDTGKKDLIIGMEECDQLFHLFNKGSQNEAMYKGFTNAFPNTSHPVEMNTFPAAFFQDINSDGVKDLIVSPNVNANISLQIDFQNSVWFYKNKGSNQKPVFEFVSRNFLQSEMIDVGENASLAFFDYDGDGDLDLFISHHGNPSKDGYISTIWHFENTGTRQSPSFKLVTKDFLNLSILKLYNASIAFSDLNSNGKLDLAIMAASEFPQFKDIYYCLNLGKNTSSNTFDPEQIKTLPIRLNTRDNVCFTDINRDGKFDLLIGKASGRLEYFQNTGSKNAPEFTLIQNDFLGITDNTRKRNIFPVVADLNQDGKPELIITNSSGDIWIYEDFQNKGNTALTKEVIFSSVSQNFGKANIGYKNQLAIANIFDDGRPAIFAGSAQGGIWVFKQEAFTGGNIPEIHFSIYPNPTKGNINLSANTEVVAAIFSMQGKLLQHTAALQAGKTHTIQTNHLPNGMYIIKVKSKDQQATKKIIIDR